MTERQSVDAGPLSPLSIVEDGVRGFEHLRHDFEDGVRGFEHLRHDVRPEIYKHIYIYIYIYIENPRIEQTRKLASLAINAPRQCTGSPLERVQIYLPARAPFLLMNILDRCRASRERSELDLSDRMAFWPAQL